MEKDRRDRGNVWLITYSTIKERRPHPAVFPVKLPQRCIELHGIEPNMLVYDPFMGIGNTALACVRLGVNYIGTEIDAGYIEIANEQISRNIETSAHGNLLSYLKDGSTARTFSLIGGDHKPAVESQMIK